MWHRHASSSGRVGWGLVEGLPETTPDEVRRGPSETIAFDEQGEPTKAAEGFARGAGLAAADLERRDGHVWATVPGVGLADVLPGRISEIVRGLAFGKSMQWVRGGLRFSRPVRWLVAMLDGETIAVEVEGVTSGSVSSGHRFTHGLIEIAHAELLHRARSGLPVSSPMRKSGVARFVDGLEGIGGWSDPGGVLEEVVYLAESPVVLEGRFDERFLQLPERVIVTAMQSHQRYFPLGAEALHSLRTGVTRTSSERATSGCSTGGSRMHPSHSSATSPSGSTS